MTDPSQWAPPTWTPPPPLPPGTFAVPAWPAPGEPSTTGEPWRRSRWGLGDVGWTALVYIVASVIAGVVIVAAALLRNPDVDFANLQLGPYAISLSVLANVAAFAGVPWLATRGKGLRSLAGDFGLQFKPIDLAIGLGLGIGGMIAAGMLVSGIDTALGADEATSNIPVDKLANVGEFLVFLLAVGIVTPVIEELFFRGLVYRSLLKRGMRTVPAIAVATLVFVAPHLLAVLEWPDFVSLFAAITVLGAAFNLACHLTGNRLGAAIIAHMVVNSTSVVVLYFWPNAA